MVKSFVAGSAWTAFWCSRLLIWAVGCAAVLVHGVSEAMRRSFDPMGLSGSLGNLGNVLAAPAVRWDSVWYISVAQHGYHSAQDTAFFPLYPLLVNVGSWLTGSAVVAAVLISLGATLAAFVLVRRLTEYELGTAPARAAVALMAFGPMALFLSAAYTEGLFIAVSAATFYAARRGRWATAGVLGGLAAMTRVTGLLLALPVLLLFFYGPREDREDREDREPTEPTSPWLPRHRVQPRLVWTLAIPGGAGLFAAYLAVRGLDPLGPLHVQQRFWNHYLSEPLGGARDGVAAAWHELTAGAGGPILAGTKQGQAIFELGALVMAAVAVAGVFKRLPVAYGAYVLLAVLVPLSSPTLDDPLASFGRYASVLFPLYMWAGAWAVDKGRVRELVGVSALLLAFFTFQFATWHWVA